MKAGARGGDERRDEALAVERSDLEDEPQLQPIMLAKVRDRESEKIRRELLDGARINQT